MNGHNSTASFLRMAFIALKKENPPVYRRLVAGLDQASTNFTVGDERFLVTVASREVKVLTGRWSRSAKAEGKIGLRDLFQLIDGTSTVVGLLNSEGLKIRADSETLLKLDSVMKLFLAAALKSGTLQNHFENYRSWALKVLSGQRREVSS